MDLKTITIKKLIFLTYFFFISFIGKSQPGKIDTTFNNNDIGFGNGVGTTDGSVYATAIQSDGKIIIGGDFNFYNTTSRTKIARINRDGSLDTSFKLNNFYPTSTGTVHTISIQNDGKIIIGGNFTYFRGISRNSIARLNSNGSLDTTFNPGTGVNGIVYTTSIRSDGVIIIGGDFTSYNGTSRNYIAGINSNGSLSGSFSGTGASGIVRLTAIQSNGNIIIGGDFGSYNGDTRCKYIARISSGGSLDATFNTGIGANSSILKAVIQSDGKIIIGGNFTNYGGSPRNYIARLNNNGGLDMTFNPGTGANFSVPQIAIQNNGKIIIGGQFSFYNGISRNGVAGLNMDGSLDSTFNPGTGASGAIKGVSVQSDGNIIIGGQFSSYSGTPFLGVARLKINGSLDETFNRVTGANFDVNASAIQSDGKIIIGGDFSIYNGTRRNYIARLNIDGSLDSTFNPGIGLNSAVYSLVIQSDGKIIIGGNFNSYYGISRNKIARLNSNGSLDTTFNPGTGVNNGNGTGVFTISIQSDGKIIIGGNFTSYNGTSRNHIARINSNGSLDATFNPGTGTNNSIWSTAIQSDGKLIIGGIFTTYNGTARNYIARLNNNGSLDLTFNPGSGFCTICNSYGIESIVVQNNGKVIFGGSFSFYPSARKGGIARLNSNGSLDSTFISYLNSAIRAIAIQSDGKIIYGGYFSKNIARINTNGSLDSTFNPGTGANADIKSMIIQSDGKIIIGGAFTSYNGTGRNRLVRILTDFTQTSCSFSINEGTDTIVVCGTSTTISAPSGFDTYSWNNGLTTSSITATSTGWYTCSVTQGSCSATDSVFLRISNVLPSAPTAITITAIQTNVCGERKYRYAVPVSTASSFTGYLWSFQGPLFSSMTIDSGSLNSRVLTVTYTSNDAASASDSLKCRYTSICGNSIIKAAKLSNTALNVPAAPTSITITTVAQNVCGNRLYRYSAPNLPAATTTTGAATGWVWEITGSLSEFSNIDSGDLNTQKILVSFTSNNASTAGDSIKLYYTSGCGDGKTKASKLSNTSLKVPTAPTAITITPLQTNVCGARRYRYTAPILPVATTTSGAATGYVWDVKGSLSSTMTIDSGSLTSRSFIARFTSNAAASAGDSVRVYYTSDCGNSLRRASKLSNTLLNVPAAPATIAITALQTDVCGVRRYRYTAPVLPAATTTSGAASGYVWDVIGSLSSTMIVDSGTLTSHIFTATFTSNASSTTGDSVRVYYTSGCGNSLRKSSKLTNTLLSAPLAPATIAIQLKNDVCNARTYRYIAPVLPAATATAGAASGYLWASPIGLLGSTGTIDSGNVNSKIITVTYSSNAAVGIGDSIKLQYSSGCGNGAVKAQKLSNVAKVCPSGIIAKADPKEISNTPSMHVFPNPNNGNFTIKIQTGLTTTRKALIEIRDIQGRLIHALQTQNVNGVITERVRKMGFSKGVYVVMYNLGDMRRSIKMIVE